MQKIKIEPFKVIGIMIRTSNLEGQSAQDIGKLWERLMTDEIVSKIPHKIDSTILSIYTNYEGDHLQPYDAILGCRVSSLEEIPAGMIGRSIDGGNYSKFTYQGDITQGMIYKAWLDIWSKGLSRSYTTDFEEYAEKAQNPKDAEVDILIATN